MPEVDLTIWGTPMRSWIMSIPRASTAKAPMAPMVAGLGFVNSRVKMPTMPNSCTPAPAGVIGTNPSAVTSGCIRKYPIRGICVMPNAKPKKYHSRPLSTQQIMVKPTISGIALRFFCEFPWTLRVCEQSACKLFEKAPVCDAFEKGQRPLRPCNSCQCYCSHKHQCYAQYCHKKSGIYACEFAELQPIADGTTWSRKINAPTPPATLTRNSMVLYAQYAREAFWCWYALVS